ncbi:MAG: hypothetical protein SFU98_02735 [Leptospiraceae bacterium]|nr:hypothetical protein [Leptospiraceae bacterium]
MRFFLLSIVLPFLLGYCKPKFDRNLAPFFSYLLISNKSSTSNETSVSTETTTTTSSFTPIIATISPAYTGNSNWMDYIRRDMGNPSSIAQTTVTDCDGTETGWYNSCIHVGEIRRFELSNVTDCTDISASDLLAAFNWVCAVQSGKVYIYSTGLKYEKNLSDLIDFSNVNWKDNSVTVTKASQTIATTTPAKWWTNPILVRAAGATLTTSSTINIITTNITGQFTIGANKVGLIIKPENILSNSSTVINFSATSNFSWIEGKINCTINTQMLTGVTNSGKFSQFRNLSVSRATGNNDLIDMSGSSVDLGQYYHNFRVANLTNVGVNINVRSKKTIFNGLNSSNANKGIFPNSNDLIFLNVVTANQNNFGIDTAASASNNNFYINLTSSNSSQDNIQINSPYTNSTLNNVLMVNGEVNGFDYNSNLSNNTLLNTISAHNNTAHFSRATTNSVTFKGILKTSSTSCSISGGGTPGLNSTCGKIAPSELTPPTDTTANLSNSFVGKVTTNDSINVADSNGFASTPTNDPYGFENLFRNWGVDPGVFPVAANRGACTNNCRIWDWSLVSTDTQARATNACPDGSSTNTQTWSDATTITYLRNAQELMFDGVGNDNGICESNEDCLWTPNIGAYQGHGSIIKGTVSANTPNDQSCSDIGTGGTIQNVKIFKYQINGY